jgi:hypothetical protein
VRAEPPCGSHRRDPDRLHRARQRRPARLGTATLGSSQAASLAKCPAISSARAANRRSQPRTVVAGTSSSTAIGRCPDPAALASSALPITLARSRRRSSTPPAAAHGSPGRRGSGPAAGEHAAGSHHGRAATGRAPNPTRPARHHTPGRPAHPRQAPARPRQGRLLPSAPVRLAPPARPSRPVGPDGEGLARSRHARACCPGGAAANSDPRHEPEPQLIPTISAAPDSLQPQRESRPTAVGIRRCPPRWSPR